MFVLRKTWTAVVHVMVAEGREKEQDSPLDGLTGSTRYSSARVTARFRKAPKVMHCVGMATYGGTSSGKSVLPVFCKLLVVQVSGPPLQLLSSRFSIL